MSRFSRGHHDRFLPMLPLSPPQTLLIDADDTLWENNIYFERTIADFIERLNHQHMSPQEVRLFLNDVERENILKHGYGSHSFRSEEHTSELQSPYVISYAVFCL